MCFCVEACRGNSENLSCEYWLFDEGPDGERSLSDPQLYLSCNISSHSSGSEYVAFSSFSSSAINRFHSEL